MKGYGNAIKINFLGKTLKISTLYRLKCFHVISTVVDRGLLVRWHAPLTATSSLEKRWYWPQKAASSLSLHDALVMFAMVSAHYFAHSDVSKTWCFCIVFQSPRIVNLVIGMSMSDVLIGDHKQLFFFPVYKCRTEDLAWTSKLISLPLQSQYAIHFLLGS